MLNISLMIDNNRKDVPFSGRINDNVTTCDFLCCSIKHKKSYNINFVNYKHIFSKYYSTLSSWYFY